MAMLKQQAEVRDQLLATMAQQLTDLQSTCDKELATVEAAHVQVRARSWTAWCRPLAMCQLWSCSLAIPLLTFII